MSIDAMKQALEAMEEATGVMEVHLDHYFEAMNVLRTALAQQAEPVQAWHFVDCEGECLACLIEREVKAAFGNQGLTYLLRHVGGQDE